MVWIWEKKSKVFNPYSLKPGDIIITTYGFFQEPNDVGSQVKVQLVYLEENVWHCLAIYNNRPVNVQLNSPQDFRLSRDCTKYVFGKESPHCNCQFIAKTNDIVLA